MRLLRRATADGAVLAVVVHERAIDVSDLPVESVVLPRTIHELLVRGSEGLSALRAAAERVERSDRLEAAAGGDVAAGLALDAVRWLPPVGHPRKIVAVGRNYRDHAAEEGAGVPPAPLLFAKFSSSLVGHREEIRWRASDTTQVDFEAELGVVIGRGGRDIPASEALDHVLGYTCIDDVSARDLQFGDGQWTRGKSLDTFCPTGPWLVTTDDVLDPQSLGIRCLVNGEVVQEASTAEMVHGVAAIIAYCSRYFSLEPGDLIATGTPGGVGVFREPPRFLLDGDEVTVDIDGVGTLVNRCRVLAEPV